MRPSKFHRKLSERLWYCASLVVQAESGKCSHVRAHDSAVRRSDPTCRDSRTYGEGCIRNHQTRVRKIYIVSSSATKLHRFSIAMAFFSEGAWRLHCRIVTTLNDGLLCFPLWTTFDNANGIYNMPDVFKLNTVLIHHN